MDHMEIRLATPDDVPAMAEVLTRSWEAAYKDILPAEHIRRKNATRLDMYRNAITAENRDTYVILFGGKTAGVMKIAPPVDADMGENAYELHYIYLHPDFFRKGIGTRAMEFAFQKARALGKTKMSVEVFAQNANAISFYRKCGFMPDGHKDFHRVYDLQIETIRMIASLKN